MQGTGIHVEHLNRAALEQSKFRFEVISRNCSPSICNVELRRELNQSNRIPPLIRIVRAIGFEHHTPFAVIVNCGN